MPSKLKSETARLNGAKSRGPKSAEGLAKSSCNALKHGFASGSAIVLLCENSDEFKLILADFIATYNPTTPAEKDLIEEMVAARWRIRRLWTIETSLINAEMLRPQTKIDSPDPGIHLALAFRALADHSCSLALATRYESHLQRTYARAYRTLRELQQLRELPNEPTSIRVQWIDGNPDSPTGVPPTEAASEPVPPPPSATNHATEPTEPRESASGPVHEEPGSLNAAFRVLRSFATRIAEAFGHVDTKPGRRLVSIWPGRQASTSL